MERYNIITSKKPREIVLLKSFPCIWGKCTFCDYTEDNSINKEELLQINHEILTKVTGETGVLEIINSGSCFELPIETLEEIRCIIIQKQVKQLLFESHWVYRHKLQEMRDFMGIPILFKIGVETFHNEFRQNYLKKNADFKTPEEVRNYFDSPCLLVGIKGQTKEMVEEDIRHLKRYFDHGTINVFTNNSTPVKKDEALIEWFIKKYKYLEHDSAIEILYENTDFGVGT
ncbi:radical SAM protein [Anaerocolumna cellulosilytica]|uniref:Radical SAM protein n=1 Tax=Anaerocolumna cellulosilytica TaxID=433286 RepID=A0A6S6R3V1_9FIRM|nr:radical SAM protein [Anaerocolumna cellulosilytica]MBB5197243.1 radical SAM enzyme (TIGR01210 family) [Anaerocolumna cellulosilytica]BCJ94050.1 radical SAM protein [Anaerocolumna cellulosilytica]